MHKNLVLALACLSCLPAYAADNSNPYGKYAPPSVARELSEKIQSYLDVRAPGAGRLDAEGKHLYFTWGVTGTSQVWRLDGPRSFPVQLTGGELSTSVLAVTPDGKQLIVSRDRSGEENPGLYVMSTTGGPLKAIQHKTKVQTRFNFLSRDGRYVYYSSNDQSPGAYAIYRYSLSDGSKELLINEPGLWSVADYQTDGTLLLAKYTGSNRNEIYEWKPGSGAPRPILGQGGNDAYDVSYGAAPGELIVVTNKFSDFSAIYSYKDGQFTAVGPQYKWDVASAALDPDRTRIFYSVNENGYARLYQMDARTYQPIKLPEFPGADGVGLASMDINGRRVTLGVSRPTAPGLSYSYDLQTGALEQWVVPSSPEVDTSNFVSAELEYYPARDGTPIPMLVRRPPQCREQLCPVLVDFHGGPEGQATPGFSKVAQLFLDEGFIFVEPNVRGSDGFGRKWLDADNGAKRLDVITDIQDAGLYIRKAWAKNGVAPKIGVMGGSYGGYATNLAMTLFAGTYDAGSSVVGMSNLVTFIENTADYRRALRMNEYGDPAKDREVMEKLSPIFYVDRINAPLQIIQGANDPRVPVSEAVQLFDKMNEKKIPGSLIVFPDEGHGVSKRSNLVLYLGAQLDFFKRTLLGK